MKLVTFGIDDLSDLIVQFLLLVLPYSQSSNTLYQIEIVPVLIINQNTDTSFFYITILR